MMPAAVIQRLRVLDPLSRLPLCITFHLRIPKLTESVSTTASSSRTRTATASLRDAKGYFTTPIQNSPTAMTTVSPTPKRFTALPPLIPASPIPTATGSVMGGRLPTTWYCWEAKIGGLPTASTFHDYSSPLLAGVAERFSGPGWFVDNRAGLLTSHVHMNDDAGGNVAGY